MKHIHLEIEETLRIRSLAAAINSVDSARRKHVVSQTC